MACAAAEDDGEGSPSLDVGVTFIVVLVVSEIFATTIFAVVVANGGIF
jgi:hypothetical protein